MSLIMEQMPIVIHALNIGFIQTLKLFFVTLIGAIPLGLVIAFGSMNGMRPLGWLFSKFHYAPKNLLMKAVGEFKPIRVACRFLVWIIRGTPLMIQLLIIYYFPGLVLNNNIWGSGETGRFIASAVAFIINYACYFSEIYRGGIESIPRGQYEAGQVLGMTKGQIFRKIVLLQVIKRILAPMSNEIITLVKDTSLARIIGIYEVIWAGEQFIRKGLLWPLLYTGVFYLVFNGGLTILFDRLEKKLSYFRG